MTQTSQRDTTRDPLSSPSPLLPGRRVQLSGANYQPGPVYGAVVRAITDQAEARVSAYADDAGVWEYAVRLEGLAGYQPRDGAARIDLVEPCYVSPVKDFPPLLVDDPAALRGAAEYIARSRGQLEAFRRGSYNDAAYKAAWDSARDLAAAMDAERRRQARCRYIYRDESAVLECAFYAEPGGILCGVHEGSADWRHGGSTPSAAEATRRVEPVGAYDPLVTP